MEEILGQEGNLGMEVGMTVTDWSVSQMETLLLCPDLARAASSSDRVISWSLKTVSILTYVWDHPKLLWDGSAPAPGNRVEFWLYLYLQLSSVLYMLSRGEEKNSISDQQVWMATGHLPWELWSAARGAVWFSLGTTVHCYLLGFKEKDAGSGDQKIQCTLHTLMDSSSQLAE